LVGKGAALVTRVAASDETPVDKIRVAASDETPVDKTTVAVSEAEPEIAARSSPRVAVPLFCPRTRR
jgi:hypothetical protein